MQIFESNWLLLLPGLLHATDAGTGLLSPAVTPGSTVTMSNSPCTLNGTGSSFGTSGNNLTLNINLTFSGTFFGQKNVYLYSSRAAGVGSRTL